MVKPMHEQDPRVKLLTVLNVQSAKPAKRSAPSSTVGGAGRDWYALARAATKSSSSSASTPSGTKQAKALAAAQAAATFDAGDVEAEEEPEGGKKKRRKVAPSLPAASTVDEKEEPLSDADSDDEDSPALDSFASHFAASSNPLLPESLSKEALEEAVSKGAYWGKSKKRTEEAVGEAVVFTPKDSEVEPKEAGLEGYNEKLVEKMKRLNDGEGKSSATPLAWLSQLSTYRDVLYPRLELGEAHEEIRQAASLHAMNHVLKTRTKILKNNEYLSKQAALAAAAPKPPKQKKGAVAPPPTPSSATPARDTTDQSFTRPKVLILCPFRSSALSWMGHLLSFLPPSCTQIDQYPRFVSEYSLPPGAVDKLAERPDDYPADHRETFSGNIDDSFRVGVKVTRKSARVFAAFYEADVVVASPLGLRTSIEKDGDSDFLSSIEMVIVDQMDVMEMQNWEHLQFVMSRLNLMPESDHGCDFSRVKPWYLDGKSAHLRQSLLLSRFETPEIRHLFNTSLLNRAGKIKALTSYDGVMDKVPRGVKQVWTRFECEDVALEEEKRFEWFTTKTLPTLLRSAVASSQTLLLVPSYFDFLRVKRYLTLSNSLPSDFSFAAISEYTDTPDVSRARGAFIQGKVKWLIITERFHFYKRYRLRGAKTFVFYSPPSHPSYYPELLSFPFFPPSSLSAPSAADFAASGLEGDVDESELSAQVVFSKWDLMRLERIVGTQDARRMVKEEGGGEGGKRFTFL